MAIANGKAESEKGEEEEDEENEKKKSKKEKKQKMFGSDMSRRESFFFNHFQSQNN